MDLNVKIQVIFQWIYMYKQRKYFNGKSNTASVA